jgi:hypothetical protein
MKEGAGRVFDFFVSDRLCGDVAGDTPAPYLSRLAGDVITLSRLLSSGNITRNELNGYEQSFSHIISQRPCHC